MVQYNRATPRDSADRYDRWSEQAAVFAKVVQNGALRESAARQEAQNTIFPATRLKGVLNARIG